MGVFSKFRSLFMRRRPIRVVFHDASFVYDGMPHAPAYAVDGLPEGLSLLSAESRSWTDATHGRLETQPSEWHVISASGRDVTRRFAIEETSAHIEIVPALLVVCSGSASKIWDGAPLECPDVSITGLASGESLSVRTVGSLSDEGSTTNDLVVDWGQSSACKDNYELRLMPGTLTVEPAALVGVEAVFSRAVYDAAPHGFEIHAPEGARVERLDAPHHRDVGVYEARYVVTMPHHAPANGVARLEILPRRLLVRAESASKVWDGEPLSSPQVKVEGLVPGECLVAHATGVITDEGVVENPIEVDWEASTACKGNYELEVVSGALEVELAQLDIPSFIMQEVTYDGRPQAPAIDVPQGAALDFDGVSEFSEVGCHRVGFTVSAPHHRVAHGVCELAIVDASDPVHVITTGGKFRYDGEDHGATVELMGLPAGYVVKEARSTACARNVADAAVLATCDVLRIEDLVGRDATGALNFLFSDSTITIEPRPVNLMTFDARKRFDGKPLTSKQARVSGLVEGETATPVVRGEQTQVGQSVNAAELVFDGTARAENYRVIPSFGKLTVIPAEVPEPLAPAPLALQATELPAPVPPTPQPVEPLASAPSAPQAVEPSEPAPSTSQAADLPAPDPFAQQLAESSAPASQPAEPSEPASQPVESASQPSGLAPQTPALVPQPVVPVSPAPQAVEPSEPAPPALRAPALPEPDSLAQHAPEPSAPAPQPSEPVSPAPQTPAPVPPAPQPAAPVAWKKPDVAAPAPAGNSRQASRRRRGYTKTPVDERPDLEEMNLGRGFNPFAGQDVHRQIGDADLVRRVRFFEERARIAIEQACDQYVDVLLFQTFGMLGTDLDELCKTVKGVLDYRIFRADKRCALAYIHDNCQNAFLVFVACLAREYSNADGIWSEIFKFIDVGNDTNKNLFKRMFVSYLYQRHLPVFESNEAAHYLARTAYLHGGFSRDVWMALWGDALVGMAKDKRIPEDASGDLVFGYVLSCFPELDARHKRIKELLRKAPQQAVASLFEMAWKVVVQVVHAGPKPALITNYGLSQVAMSALVEVLDGRSMGAPKPTRQRIVFLDKARLILDEGGRVHVAWSDTDLPSSMAGSRVDLFVNGALAKSCDIVQMTRHARLGGGSVEVAPCTRYDVELRLMAPSPHEGYAEVASMFQSFQNARPACYEFVRTPQGEYRFREPDERIMRKRRMAYLVPGGMRVNGLRGMELLNVMECMGSWEAMRVFEFNVEPGASGAIEDERSGEVLAAWHEDFRVRVDKAKAIGRVGDVDLYGHVMGVGQTDVALPSIKIEAPEGTAPDDVEVRFVRDGSEGPLDATWTLDQDGRPLELQLSFPQVEQGRGIARLCAIEARQRTTGSLLLRYRFAIVPIQGFRIVDCKIVDGQLYGVYGFTATEDLEVSQIAGSIQYPDALALGEDAFIETLLEEQMAHIRFATPAGDAMEAELLLAGVKVQFDADLRLASMGAPLNLASLQNCSLRQTELRLSTSSPRKGLFVQVNLGRDVLRKKMLDKATEFTVNLLESEALFIPAKGKIYEDCPLSIFIGFGFELKEGKYVQAVVAYELMRCAKGLGFKDCKVRLCEGGRHQLCFDADTPSKTLACDLDVTYTDGSDYSPMVYGHSFIEAGQRRVELPQEVRDLYRQSRRRLYATVTTVSLFGVPDPSKQITFSLRSRKDAR